MRPTAVGRRILVVAFVAATCASCASLPRTQFTEKEQNIAQIPGMLSVRFYTDAPLAEIERALKVDAMRAAAKQNGGFQMLAISGGAWDGAYGAVVREPLHGQK